MIAVYIRTLEIKVEVVGVAGSYPVPTAIFLDPYQETEGV